MAAHRALGRHFSDRQSCWPLRNSSPGVALAGDSRALSGRTPPTRPFEPTRSPAGVTISSAIANVSCGTPPDWHHDPINDARAPQAFWATIPYLEPACGDHKVIWELNRHQHWRQLGRAYWLTATRAIGAPSSRISRAGSRRIPAVTGINWSSMLELAFRSLSWTWAVEFFCDDAERDDDALARRPARSRSIAS